MIDEVHKRVSRSVINGLSRREFLIITSMAATGLAVGCAINPVTGKSQFMIMDEKQEIAVDRQQSPHQFSSDYGTVQDRRLQDYIQTTGKQIAANTHRSQMPYDFHCVNANYINAYAFPGGSIACTRGILLEIDNEAELAALLASYSRDNERQADDLGMEYMAKSGYSPQGMVGLMEMLNSKNQRKAGATYLLFSTHPMSTERYKTSVSQATNDYRKYSGQPLFRERYMDTTAGLRKIKGAIKRMQDGEEAMGKEQYSQAEGLFKQALDQVPDDYTGLLLMAKCQLVQKKDSEAERYAGRAKQVYPDEAQAYHISGITKIRNKKYDAAYEDFSIYERYLPGNPNTVFFKGLSLEGMQKIEPAAQAYNRYLKQIRQGKQAQYAYKRLKEWGYIK